MRVLAIDTALAACSVAVVDSEEETPAALRSTLMERGHAEALMPMVAEVLAEAGGLASIQRIAVTTGPGSFTGLRVGLAAARGLALGANLPIVGISSLTALAAPLLVGNDRRSAAAAIDARHGRVFLHVFTPAGRTLVAPRCALARDAARAIGTGPVRLVGSGAALIQEASEFPGSMALEDAPSAPDITWVARLGAAVDPASAPPEPFYLLAPDAHPQAGGRVARR